jgi:hypothetical protein
MPAGWLSTCQQPGRNRRFIPDPAADLRIPGAGETQAKRCTGVGRVATPETLR